MKTVAYKIIATVIFLSSFSVAHACSDDDANNLHDYSGYEYEVIDD